MRGRGCSGSRSPSLVRQQVLVTPDSLRDLRVAVLYVEDAGEGRGRNVKIPLATVGANGETAIKDAQRQNPQTINLTFGVVKPPAGPSLIIDGKAA